MSESGALAEKREQAASILREMLDKMGIDAEVSAFDDGERIILDAHGSESGLVIGKKGATLDALQYLVNRMVFRAAGEKPLVTVDAVAMTTATGVVFAAPTTFATRTFTGIVGSGQG